MKHTHMNHDVRWLAAGTAFLVLLLGLAAVARAQTGSSFTLGGYAETYLQWNFNDPSNGITNYRGFDNRHDSFTISNLALDAQWDRDNVIGRLALQVGHAADTYYLGEPALPGAGGAAATGPDVWKYVQQAQVGYRDPGERAWALQAGVFLSPIGPEGIAVRDNWNWSRSNLFFGLPFYHTGARFTWPFDASSNLSFAVYNGWNSVVDNNREKSVCAQYTFGRPSSWSASLLYFGGVERATGAAEGRPWRHLLDAYVTWEATPRLSLLAHADAGFESNRFGTSRWTAGALYARYRASGRIYLAARVDGFDEDVAANESGSASPIFWPASWVSSVTLTLDYRPAERASFRVEYRGDRAASDMYFGGEVAGDGITEPYEANRANQGTITVGAVTWF